MEISMYQLQPIDPLTGQPATTVKRLADNAFIPFDNANTDFAQAKLDLSEGAELLDAEGVAMTQAEVDAFLLTLP